ncbi:hypothetical protein HanRHA438_Chr12g0537201 [Helianthus annuus]|nr:hypothetical protein HanRHA438_Chr12g0537201 [Helianthus annuus]
MYTLMINGSVAQKNKGGLGGRKALNDISNSRKPSALQPSKKHNTKNMVGGSVTAYLYHLWVVEADGQWRIQGFFTPGSFCRFSLILTIFFKSYKISTVLFVFSKPRGFPGTPKTPLDPPLLMVVEVGAGG